MTFRHYVITRFNVPGVVQANPSVARSLEWCQRRLELMERTLISSLAVQTVKDFTWVMLVDSAVVAPLAINSVSVLPVTAKNWKAELAEYVRRTAESDFVLTTRMDSDDCYQRTALEQLQTFAKRLMGLPPMDYYMDFPAGYVVHDKSDNVNYFDYSVTWRMASPFLSRVEPTEKCRTVYELSHARVKASGALVTDIGDGVPMWLQLIHGDNSLTREMRGNRMPFRVSDVAPVFGLTL